MLKSTRNQLGNARNPYQGEARKVLCVCSAGLLRSPSLANVLHTDFGYNTRACGTSQMYALIPLSEALVEWADEIIFTDQEAYDSLDQLDKEYIKDSGAEVFILDIPDNYDYMHPTLVEAVLHQYTSLG